jgi:hypothetical protein
LAGAQAAEEASVLDLSGAEIDERRQLRSAEPDGRGLTPGLAEVVGHCEQATDHLGGLQLFRDSLSLLVARQCDDQIPFSARRDIARAAWKGGFRDGETISRALGIPLRGEVTA